MAPMAQNNSHSFFFLQALPHCYSCQKPGNEIKQLNADSVIHKCI